jgi:peptidyl-prolyl cis-trans isomerase C
MRIKSMLLAGALALVTLPVLADSGQDKPFLIVNGVTLPDSYAEVIRRDRANHNGDAKATSDDAVRDALATLEVLAQEAEKKGLDKRDDFKAVLALQRDELLVKLVEDDFVKHHTIDEARLRSEYDKAKAKAGDTEYLASHILVPSEKQAKDIIEQLKRHRKLKFEDLAKKYSKDSSASEGGSLGWMSPSNLVPEFAQAMTALKKGSYTTTPVKTQFGWHIIKLDDVRKLQFPDFDKVKGTIARQLMQIDFRKYVAELRNAAKIEVPVAK